MNIELKLSEVQQYVEKNMAHIMGVAVMKQFAVEQITRTIADMIQTSPYEIVSLSDSLSYSFVASLMKKGKVNTKFGLYMKHSQFPIFYSVEKDVLAFFDLDVEWEQFTESNFVLVEKQGRETLYSLALNN
jgi:hypothetical protein